MSINQPANMWLNKFGWNPEVDAGVTADVWDGGLTGGTLLYPWPAAAAATTIVGGAEDVKTTGTGAWTVEVQGLDTNYNLASETVDMNGATPVALTTEFLRVFRAKVRTSGTDGTNNAAISIKHAAQIIAMISAGKGQTLMAVYTVPAGQELYLAGVYGSATFTAAGTITFKLDVRPFGGSWNNKLVIILGGNTGTYFQHRWDGWQSIAAKSDVRVQVSDGTDNDMVVTAGFDCLRKIPGV